MNLTFCKWVVAIVLVRATMVVCVNSKIAVQVDFKYAYTYLICT